MRFYIHAHTPYWYGPQIQGQHSLPYGRYIIFEANLIRLSPAQETHSPKTN
jgi:hypothetical protein